MCKSQRKVLCYVKIPCQWRILQISKVAIPNQQESNILYSLRGSFCYYPNLGKKTFENTKNYKRMEEDCGKFRIIIGIFQTDLVVLMENVLFYSNQRTLGLITETVKGLTILSSEEWLRQNMISFLPMWEWTIEILKVAIGPKAP